MIKSYSQNDTLIAKDGTLLAGTNYDNQPIEGVAPDDYVITAGIGWEL